MTIIKDPKIEPYFIKKEEFCYTLYLNVKPKEGKEYNKPIGYYANLEHALNKIPREKTNLKESYDSIKEYVEEYKKIKNEIENLFKSLIS